MRENEQRRLSQGILGGQFGFGEAHDRLLDLRHQSRLDQIEQALRVLGKRLSVTIGDAA